LSIVDPQSESPTQVAFAPATGIGIAPEQIVRI
jgi:hypothetical protein